jgi:predicted SprT family Zn-dependent metalloprotease
MGLVKDILDILDKNEDWKNMKAAMKRIKELEERLALVESKLEGKHSDIICDHCASPDLERKGSRPHPVFGDVGLKEAIYQCRKCNQQTFVELP